jgi:DNA-binding NtrC family response regulator
MMTEEELADEIQKFMLSEIKARGFFGCMGKMEEALLQSALEATGGNRNKAARLTKLNRTTLIAKLKKYGLQDFMKGPKKGHDEV